MPRSKEAHEKRAPRRPEDRLAPLTVSRPALLVNGSDIAFRGLVHELLAFSHHMNACREGFARILGITGVQYELVQVVRRFQEDAGISVGAVAARMHRSGVFITMESGKLAERGLLEKRVDPRDARRVLLRVTAAGEALIQRVAPYQQRVNDVLFACLDEARFRQLRELADGLVACGDRASNLIKFLVRDALLEEPSRDSVHS